MLLYLGVIFDLVLFPRGYCYNLDVDHPIIIENPDLSQNGSYFGYSAVLYGDKKEKWIKVGAPKVTYNAIRGSIHESGMVYHCPFMDKCEEEEHLNYTASKNLANSWTGGAIDISYRYKTLAISATRWHTLGRTAFGAFFINNFKNKTFQGRYAPLQTPEDKEKSYYYRYALSGFSLHFPQNKNELLMGAPGVYNYVGTVFRILNIDQIQEQWKYEIIEPKGNYYEYSGYAVTSGYFYKKNELQYVTGLPRGFKRNSKNKYSEFLHGSVIVFNFSPPRNTKHEKNQVPISEKITEIYGTQSGEYFGSSVAAGDLNGDGLDDLIVGAPFRQNEKAGFNHGSIYIFYGNPNKFRVNPKVKIDGLVSGGQFGTALMVLGDLDNNNFNELAVSAPFQGKSGVVYIYTFNSAANRLKLSQKILGDDLYPDLKGFGVSFSKATDMDDNGLVDFAIGSPLSGHVIILRSKPTVFVNVSIQVSSSINRSETMLSFRCYYAFKAYANLSLSIIRNITVDEDFNRFYFKNNQCFEEKYIIIQQDQDKFELINLTKREVHNYDKPISIKLTYRIAEQNLNKKAPLVIRNQGEVPKDNFCKMCPVLNKKSKRYDSKLVFWDHNCYHNGRKAPCKSKLEVRAKFTNLGEENTFVIGTTELATLKVEVANKGDLAFSPSLQVRLPNGVSLMGHDSCQTIDANNIKCDGGEVLNENKTYVLKLNFNINVDDTNDLDFILNASTITENINDKSIANLTIKVERDADFLVTGFSEEPSYVYEKGKPTLIKNKFQIEKFGRSPTPPAELVIMHPYKIKSHDGTYVQFANLLEDNDTFLQSMFTSCDKSTTKSLEDENGFEYAEVFYINCTNGNVECLVLNCTIRSFEGSQNDFENGSVNVQFDFQNLTDVMDKEKLAQIDQIIVTTRASISTRGFTQNGNRSDFAELSNIVLVHKDLDIPWWILIGAVAAGLVLLVCVSIGLAKDNSRNSFERVILVGQAAFYMWLTIAIFFNFLHFRTSMAGFFERKKHKMLMQLKEEALEEERIIEEMIQKECETENPFYGDPNAYMDSEDLQIFWKRTDEEFPHNTLLLNNDRSESTEQTSCAANAPLKEQSNHG